MFRKNHLLIPALVFYTGMVLADGMPSDEKPAIDPNDDRSELEMTTCGDLFELFDEATPEDDRDPDVLARAQDDLLYFVVWVHGYLSGLHGIDEEKRPMGKEGVVQLINQMAEACEPDKSKLFLDAARSIK